jgi:hypothetical protein
MFHELLAPKRVLFVPIVEAAYPAREQVVRDALVDVVAALCASYAVDERRFR